MNSWILTKRRVASLLVFFFFRTCVEYVGELSARVLNSARNCDVSRIDTTHLVHQLAHYSVPLAGLVIVNAVLAIRNELDLVAEAHHVSYLLEQVDAEALVTCVPAEIPSVLHHNVWLLLWGPQKGGYYLSSSSTSSSFFPFFRPLLLHYFIRIRSFYPSPSLVNPILRAISLVLFLFSHRSSFSPFLFRFQYTGFQSTRSFFSLNLSPIPYCHFVIS